MRKYLLFFVILLPRFVYAQSVTINSGTTWSVPTLSAGTIITKGGKNYETTESSDVSHTLLKVTALVAWTISVRQVVGANWDPALKVYVKRTGPGTGLAIVSGGTAFQEVTATAQPFFTGLLSLTGNRDNIPIQYQIQGLSVLLPAKTYSTTIQYTISGL